MASLLKLARARFVLLLLGLSALGVAGCYNQPIEAQAPSNDDLARQVVAFAEKYCREADFTPGTAHFDDCVTNKSISLALEARLLQQAASGQAVAPPPAGNVYVVTPAQTSCVPDVRGMSAGAAFAAGFRGC